MPLSGTIEAQLPFLRRYARAVTGSTAVGDRLVESALIALMKDKAGLDTAASARAFVFRALDRLISRDHSARAPGGPLALLSAVERRTVLLISMEELSVDETAYVFGCSNEHVSERLIAVEDHLSRALATDILIIEDEVMVSAHLASIVTEIGHRVVAQATTRAQAVERFTATQPKLILADVQLADGSSGADAVEEIHRIAKVPAIFITAYPERLLGGADGEPTYLIAKPFRPEMVKAVISQALLSTRLHPD